MIRHEDTVRLRLSLSFPAIAMLPLSLTAIYLAWRFPWYPVLRAVAIGIGTVNGILFFRYKRPRGRVSLVTRIMRSRFFPRKLYLTMEGRFLLLVTFGVGFAAINTGSNILYLILGMLLSLMVASGILSGVVLRGVDWEITIPDTAICGVECLIPIKVYNRKKRFNSYSLEAQLVVDDEDVKIGSSVAVKLPPKSCTTIYTSVTFLRRGLCPVAGSQVGTGYPFSFFFKTIFRSCTKRILVYPNFTKRRPRMNPEYEQGDENSGRKQGRGLEFYSTRPMYPGDEWRQVHWKQTAKQGKFMVKEFESLTFPVITVVITKPGARVPEVFVDETIDAVASLVVSLLQNGYKVGLIAGKVRIDPVWGGWPAAKKLLAALALLDGEKDFDTVDCGVLENAKGTVKVFDLSDDAYQRLRDKRLQRSTFKEFLEFEIEL